MQPIPGQQPMYYQQPAQYTNVHTVPAGGGPDTLVAYLLWLLLGAFGIHHLYIGRGIGVWLISIITFQGLGIWWLLDLFLIPSSCASRRNRGMVYVR